MSCIFQFDAFEQALQLGEAQSVLDRAGDRLAHELALLKAFGPDGVPVPIETQNLHLSTTPVHEAIQVARQGIFEHPVLDQCRETIKGLSHVARFCIEPHAHVRFEEEHRGSATA